MTWSISEVAKVSGTTPRTLRHYDDIGLLSPAFTGENGYRYYGQDEMLRLQQILLYREFGVPLNEIRHILDGHVDEIIALLAHQRRIRKEQRRLHQLERTITRTLTDIKEQRTMALKDIFEGFDAAKQAGYEKEIVEKYGDEAEAHIAESYKSMETWTKDDGNRQMDLWHNGLREVGTLMQAGASPSDDKVQAAITGHYRFISAFWAPTRDAYIGLGDMYVADERFAVQFEEVAPGLATFFRDAMVVYADHHLAG
jgi:DNA-binding transcriptional MerR regulator